MSKSLLACTAVVVLGIVTQPTPIKAADRNLPRQARADHYRPADPYCGCCGCLRVSYDYHRELLSTYGTKFDPRNFDQTEPYYYFGRVRAYPQFWIDRGGNAPHY
jgi:hypothetical protein